MPLPVARRADEYARKAVDLLLRQLALAPEQRAARHLRDVAPQASPDGKRVLVLTPRDWAAHVQYESMIAQALRLRGADVCFLTCGGALEICDRANTYEAPPMPCRSCTRYVHTSIDAHGFERLSIRDGWEADDPGSWPELDHVTIGDLGELVDGGLPLGRVVDIPLKWFLCAAELEAEPLTGLHYRSFLRSARRIVKGVERALDLYQPDIVLMLNGLFLFEGVTWAVCRSRSIDVVTYERAFLKETLVFSRDLPAGFYDFGALWAQRNRPLTPSEEAELDGYLDRRRRGEAFDQFWSFEDASVPAGHGRLVALFTNLTWDTAVLGRDLAFPDIRAWLIAVVEYFIRHPEHRLVIRIHPSELRLPGKRTRDSLEDFVRSHFPDLPSHITLVGAAAVSSSYALIDACDVGLVYTSTTGLELALAGKPVIVSGDVHYRGKGFTTDVGDPDAFHTALDNCLADPAGHRPDPAAPRRYAHFFFFRAPMPAPAVSEPVPGLARLDTDDLDDLRPGRHENIDRICAGILDGQPLVWKD